MIDYILDYMGRVGADATSKNEQDLIEKGIERYLLENGIEEDSTSEYYKKYVNAHLRTIGNKDLKSYFINYGLISDVNQIAIEFKCDGSIPEPRRKELYLLMEKLHLCGLGEKYIPIVEVKQILGTLS